MTEPNLQKSKMRQFVLERIEDATGVSGIGIVAEGIEFTDGTAAIRWLTHYSSTCIYDSIKAVDAIHGHHGRTQIRWINEDTSNRE